MLLITLHKLIGYGGVMLRYLDQALETTGPGFDFEVQETPGHRISVDVLEDDAGTPNSTQNL